MNQPTDDRLKKIEQKQEDYDRRLAEVERRTEPIPAVNVNLASADVTSRLDTIDGRLDKLERNQEKMFEALSQRITDEANETVERIEALFIKYTRPSTNGH